MTEVSAVNIYGKEVPLSLVLAYASVRHTSGAARARLHHEILECVTSSHG
jgi:hypothetical protein